ncbi:hypothetical protein OIU78_004501 [Salix suchowensis]|nr:hypothetical protein OIU78_004501 [Salix suchowensis]
MSASKSLQVRAHREDGRCSLHRKKTEGNNKEGDDELENDMDYDELDDSDVGESGNGAFFEEEAESTDDLDVDADVGMEERQRPTRCKEGETEKKGLLNWEPFWVATS